MLKAMVGQIIQLMEMIADMKNRFIVGENRIGELLVLL